MKKFSVMKYFILVGIIVGILSSCGSTSKSIDSSSEKEKPVRIANDSLEYEVIIFDIGFNRFLNTVAQPRGFHNEQFLRNRNIFSVNTYNQRALQPLRFGDLYPQAIDYESRINYGYEVNYLLFNYFLFFEQKYNQRL